MKIILGLYFGNAEVLAGSAQPGSSQEAPAETAVRPINLMNSLLVDLSIVILLNKNKIPKCIAPGLECQDSRRISGLGFASGDLRRNVPSRLAVDYF